MRYSNLLENVRRYSIIRRRGILVTFSERCKRHYRLNASWLQHESSIHLADATPIVGCVTCSNLFGPMQTNCLRLVSRSS